jgi:hypothetical protein
MPTCSVCDEPMVPNYKLGVWAHVDVNIADHWATAGKACGCNTEDARNHAVDCHVRLMGT